MATIERRNFSTIVNDLCLVKQNATGFAVAKATDPLVSAAPSTVAAMATAVATNWLASAWNNRWNLVANTLDDAHDGLFLISTLKRRRKMMNKHKLRKRRKKNRMKNKK